MTHTIRKQHDALAKAVRNMRRTHLVGQTLLVLLALTFGAFVWIADNPHIATGMGCLSVFTFLWAYSQHMMDEQALSAYRMRCNRYMLGFEQGYHDALACTRIIRGRDPDQMLGYTEGYRIGCDERTIRIREAISRKLHIDETVRVEG